LRESGERQYRRDRTNLSGPLTFPNGMRTFFLLFASCFAATAQTRSLEEFAPHFPTNAAIVWKASMQSVPARLWVYRWLPERFSRAVVSNAFVIGDFDLQRLPKSWVDGAVVRDGDERDPRPDNLLITPRLSNLSCSRQRRPIGVGDVNRQALAKRAFDYARQVGVDRALIVTNHVATNVVSFVRVIDGIPMMEDTEGFEVSFGDHGELLGFSLRWPQLQPHQFCATVTPEQIIECIRKLKSVVMPRPDESRYFERIANYVSAKNITITDAALYYGEGVFGKDSADQDHPEFVCPIVKLKATVQLGTTNDLVEIAAPILALDVKRLLRARVRR
jgi:hypothetical protein